MGGTDRLTPCGYSGPGHPILLTASVSVLIYSTLTIKKPTMCRAPGEMLSLQICLREGPGH